MNILKKLLLLNLCLSFIALADNAPLDPPYKNHVHPEVITILNTNISPEISRFNTLKLVEKQSSVKSQGKRGTCSIFSAVAMVEHLLIKDSQNFDFSEQWLEYLTAGQRGSEGSSSISNAYAIRNHSLVLEKDWRYNPQGWAKYDEDRYESYNRDVEETCEYVLGSSDLKRCLIGQRDPRLLYADRNSLLDYNSEFYDPDFYRILQEREYFRASTQISPYYIDTSSQIQGYLDEGYALLLDVDFFYGAWNHRKADEYGLRRNMKKWDKGEVSYPLRNSKDYAESYKSDNRAGHSILIVGYDSQKVLEKTVRLQNGEDVIVKSTGVYFFKNSWGTDGFGRKFKLDGQELPGYGMIAMDYAHQYGSFILYQ